MPTADDIASSAPIWTRGEPRIAGATDVGVLRDVNQDAFGRFDDVDRGEILLLVADGLGGHRGGEVASRMAVDEVGRSFFARPAGAKDAPDERLRRAIDDANEAILQEAARDPALQGMGTTVVCLLLSEEGTSLVAHVGDSRLYRMRAGSIRALTDDHSLVATLVREGILTPDEAREDPRRNQILRALGVRQGIEIEVAPVELRPGDVYLLCSDGLHGLVDDDEIQRLAHRPTRPEAVVARLIEAANRAGGSDNVTCVIVQVPEPMSVDPAGSAASLVIHTARSLLGRNDDE